MAYRHNEAIAGTRAFFDERAANWDNIISADHAVRLRRILVGLSIAPDARVLDVGCGTGVLFPILCNMLDARGVIVAADVSFQMMREASNHVSALQKRRLALPAHLLTQADVLQPPLREAFFDWVICNSCFPHFHDQQGAIHAMAALLKPCGGIVVCHSESRAAINELHRTVGAAVGGHELPDDAVMRVMIENAGLVLETLEDCPDGYLLLARKQERNTD